MGDLEVTRAVETDTPDIAGILTEAFIYKLSHDDTTWGTSPSEVFTDTEVTKQMLEGDVYIARLGGRPVATATLQWEDDLWTNQVHGAGYVHRLAVRSDFHGKGVGKQVVKFLAKQTLSKGYQYLRLDCSADNQGLCYYYEQLGFRKIEVIKKPDNYNAALYELKI